MLKAYPNSPPVLIVSSVDDLHFLFIFFFSLSLIESKKKKFQLFFFFVSVSDVFENKKLALRVCEISMVHFFSVSCKLFLIRVFFCPCNFEFVQTFLLLILGLVEYKNGLKVNEPVNYQEQSKVKKVVMKRRFKIFGTW